MRTGQLEAFFETGTEGVVWSVVEHNKVGYDALNCLQNGDYLKVFAPDETVLFEGEILLEWSRNKQASPLNPEYVKQVVNGLWVNGLQYNVAPDDWSLWFTNTYRCEFMILERTSIRLSVALDQNTGFSIAVRAALVEHKSKKRDAFLSNLKTACAIDANAPRYAYRLPVSLVEALQDEAQKEGVDVVVLTEALLLTYANATFLD